MRSLRGWVAGLALLLTSAACSTPHGPATLNLRVEGSALSDVAAGPITGEVGANHLVEGELPSRALPMPIS